MSGSKGSRKTLTRRASFAIWIGVACLSIGLYVVDAADQYFAGDGSALSAAKWGSGPGGPFNSNFIAGNVANFAAVGGTATGGSINIAGINATEDLTITSPSGTISNVNNSVVPITVAAGKTLDLGSQSVTASSTAGYNFTGPGTLALTGNTYGGGFTINSGTLVARGANAMGSGSTLMLNGGTIAANGTRDFSTKYTGGITLGGNIQLGALSSAIPLSSDTANLIFSNNTSLGSATRTITIGANGNYTLGGILAGASASGLTIANLPGATGRIILTGNNTYNGNTTISGGVLSLNASGSIANSPEIDIAGGAAFDLSGRSSTMTLTSSQTLIGSGNGTTGTIKTGANIGLTLSGTSGLTFPGFAPSTPPLITSTGTGSITVGGGNVVTVTVDNDGTPIGTGDYKLIAKGTGGGVMGTAPASVAATGDIVGGATASLIITGSELYLRIFEVPTPTPTATATLTPTNSPTWTPTNTPTLTPTPSIEGNIDYAIVSKPVPDVDMTASGSVPLMGMTDAFGNYSLTGFGSGPYTVFPTRSVEPCIPPAPNGIFANDASLISRHVVGLITLTPDQLVAAKVSGDLTPDVTALDAALVAQKVVGICSPINLSGRWKFSPIKGSYPNGVTTEITQDHRAFLMGDVNGDWDPAGGIFLPDQAEPSENAVVVSAPYLVTATGSELIVPINLANLQGSEVGAYQLDIAFDPAVIEADFPAATLAGTMSEGLTVTSNIAAPALLKVAVYGAVPVYGDGVYLNLTFKVIGPAGSVTAIKISGFRLNDGLKVVTKDGKVTVN